MSREERNSWTRGVDPFVAPELDRSALLVIDTQVDFIEGGSASVPGTASAIPHMVTVLQAFRSIALPIFHVIRLYRGDDVDRVRRSAIASGAPIVRPGSEGSQIAEALRPANDLLLDADALFAGELQAIAPNEFALWKPRWSAFYRTSLDRVLREREVTTLVVAGCNYPNCPRATIVDATERDYRVLIASDAISGVDERHVAEAARIGALSAPSAEIASAMTTINAQPSPDKAA